MNSNVADVTAASIVYERDRTIDIAYRALWVALTFDFLAFGVGSDLDRPCHATHPLMLDRSER